MRKLARAIKVAWKPGGGGLAKLGTRWKAAGGCTCCHRDSTPDETPAFHPPTHLTTSPTPPPILPQATKSTSLCGSTTTKTPRCVLTRGLCVPHAGTPSCLVPLPMPHSSHPLGQSSSAHATAPPLQPRPSLCLPTLYISSLQLRPAFSRPVLLTRNAELAPPRLHLPVSTSPPYRPSCLSWTRPTHIASSRRTQCCKSY